jgi:hypothetical protein
MRPSHCEQKTVEGVNHYTRKTIPEVLNQTVVEEWVDPGMDQRAEGRE